MDCNLLKKSSGKMYTDFFIDLNFQKDPDIEREKHVMLTDVARALSLCILKGSKIITIPFTFEYTVDGHETVHANLLIYRQNTNVIEHFEPHGNTFGGPSSDKVNKILDYIFNTFIKLLNKLINDKNKEHDPITFIKAYQVCHVIDGVQTLEGESKMPQIIGIEPNGYCVAWSMFFAELCLKNPEASSEEIYTSIMSKTALQDDPEDFLKKIIRGYTNYINSKLVKYYSRIFGERVTTAKLIDIIDRRSISPQPDDVFNFLDKMSDLLITEIFNNPISSFDNQTQSRYKSLKKDIHSATSSSDLKSNNDDYDFDFDKDAYEDDVEDEAESDAAYEDDEDDEDEVDDVEDEGSKGSKGKGRNSKKIKKSKGKKSRKFKRN